LHAALIDALRGYFHLHPRFDPVLCDAEDMPIKKKTSYQKAALKRARAAALKANVAQQKTARREDVNRPAARRVRKTAKG
jgi:hypothetical protein